MKNNDYIIFNVKNAKEKLEAITASLMGDIVAHNPQCVTRCKSWGQSVQQQKAFRAFAQKARAESATPDYQVYKANCEKYLQFFNYSQRQGYGVLTFLHDKFLNQ